MHKVPDCDCGDCMSDEHDCNDHLENTDIPWVLMCSECGEVFDRFEK